MSAALRHAFPLAVGTWREQRGHLPAGASWSLTRRPPKQAAPSGTSGFRAEQAGVLPWPRGRLRFVDLLDVKVGPVVTYDPGSRRCGDACPSAFPCWLVGGDGANAWGEPVRSRDGAARLTGSAGLSGCHGSAACPSDRPGL